MGWKFTSPKSRVQRPCMIKIEYNKCMWVIRHEEEIHFHHKERGASHHKVNVDIGIEGMLEDLLGNTIPLKSGDK